MKNNIENVNNMHKEKKEKSAERTIFAQSRTLTTLSHPNVVSIFGVVTDGSDRPEILSKKFLSGG